MVPSGSERIGAEGNTKPQPREVPCSKWCFTYNNYSLDDLRNMVLKFKDDENKYIIGEECGKENETPHLQGYVEFKIKKRLTTLKNEFSSKIHWEKAKGSKADNILYCSKEKNFHTNFKLVRPFKWPTFDKPWQIEILNIINSEPDSRKIHWYWSEQGNVGKTTFTNWLAIMHNAILCPIKTNDAFYRIAKEFENKEPIDLVVFDIPRSNNEYINYQSLEKIKDGQVISGKYEGCQCIFPSPHIIVFSNEPPCRSMLSEDRWVIHNID